MTRAAKLKPLSGARYRESDLPAYRRLLDPWLPPRILDFHVHTWTGAQWKVKPWQARRAGASYMVVETEYSHEQVRADGRLFFPGRAYEAVVFGNPTPAVDLAAANAYSAEAGRFPGLHPLLITGRGSYPPAELKRLVEEGGFAGYKVFLNWFGNDYRDITVPQMIGPAEMRLAHERRLVVLLHVPRDERLAHPAVRAGVERLASDWPGVSLVLAHCGRCYLPAEMRAALAGPEARGLRRLPNLYFDTSMVMDPAALAILLGEVESSRVLFATDLPVARMRGRRVAVLDHWVDLVLPDEPASAFRVQSDNMRASFMVYEICLAIREAAELAGLRRRELEAIFWDNGRRLLARARPGGVPKSAKADQRKSA
jgi:predicted TIM-barrel fold metal-dependent hydrolase